MFNKGLVILNAYIAYKSLLHLANRLKEEFALLGIDIEVKNNAEIRTYIDHNGNLQKEALPVDFIVYLDKDPYISFMLEKAGYRLFNSAESIRLCDDKMLTYLSLMNQGITMPKTISGPLCYANIEDETFIHNLEKELSFPMVSKTNYGSQGRGVTLIRNHEELVAREKEIAYSPRLYQEDIASSFGVDYRLIVIGEECVAAMKRINKNGDFRSNIALGGVGEEANLPASYLEIATKAASILKLDYCGVDLLEGENNEPILCEVNSNAFIEGIEKATKKNVARAYANHIYRLVYSL